jgi:hypothetical protein
MEEFDNEMIDIDALGDDKPEVKGRLQLAAEENQAGESIRSCACKLTHRPGEISYTRWRRAATGLEDPKLLPIARALAFALTSLWIC